MESEVATKCNQRNQNRRKRFKEQDEKDIDEGLITVPSIIYKDGLRYVTKYIHVFRVFCKARWVGRTLIEVLTSEFKTYSEEQYVIDINENRLKINGVPTSKEYVLQLPDQMVHYIERFETPIIDEPIEIIADEEEYIVFDKPSSIPVHP